MENNVTEIKNKEEIKNKLKMKLQIKQMQRTSKFAQKQIIEKEKKK